jgi:hypothetical protein
MLRVPKCETLVDHAIGIKMICVYKVSVAGHHIV